jgi:O-methyltransferase involved in polyketide biosynthesis
MNQFHSNHSLISPTAKLVAWWRSYSDIPYAKESSELSHAYTAVHKMMAPLQITPEQTLWGAPILEIRYKSLLREIKKSGIKQVMELASGISLRGLTMTADPTIRYIETDLPGITQEKLRLVETITGKSANSVRPNLIFAEANVLNPLDLDKAAEGLDPKKPVAIIHVGLLQYFSRQEKIEATHNIKSLLKKYGGVWITPDFDFRASMAQWGKMSPDTEKVLSAIAEATGRAMLSEAFENEIEFREFLTAEGLQAERIPQFDESIKVTSASATNIPPAVLDMVKTSLILWKITLKS